jgi:hypothetical protein
MRWAMFSGVHSLGYRHSGHGPLEKPDDLFFCELALPHVLNSPE